MSECSDHGCFDTRSVPGIGRRSAPFCGDLLEIGRETEVVEEEGGQGVRHGRGSILAFLSELSASLGTNAVHVDLLSLAIEVRGDRS